MKHDEDYEYDDYADENTPAKTLKGYKMVIILLAVILVAVSGLYFYQSHQLKADFAVERDTLTGRILAIRHNLDGLQTTNDSLNYSIIMERGRTDSVLDALAKERSATRATIRKYEAMLGTMRTAAAGFVTTIDSLNRLNRRLIDENLGMRRQVTSERRRADMAEEREADANTKIRQGAVVMARDIRLVLLNSAGREVTRVARAARIRTDFILSSNNLAEPGERAIYVRITGPDGYVLANKGAATFEFEGDALVYSAMRDAVDYRNEDLPVGIYYPGSDIAAGTYRVEIFMDGHSAGSTEILLK